MTEDTTDKILLTIIMVCMVALIILGIMMMMQNTKQSCLKIFGNKTNTSNIILSRQGIMPDLCCYTTDEGRFRVLHCDGWSDIR